MSKVTPNTIRRLQESIETQTQQYLRNSGWRYSCQNPGSLWLWEKDIDGKWYRCGDDTALFIQEALDNR